MLPARSILTHPPAFGPDAPPFVSEFPEASAEPALASRASKGVLAFRQSQAINTLRHAAGMRPFQRKEFGTGPAAPSAAHLLAANRLVAGLRRPLVELARQVAAAAQGGAEPPLPNSWNALLDAKEKAGHVVRFIEKIWNFYFTLFSQRQSRYAHWLLACDRIALDCYQAVYTGLGAARSIPTPPPFSFLETEATPSTFRRGVRLSRLGSLSNPFPIVQLPYHRLINPWTLSAIHHEVSHNIQSDLDLWTVVPTRLLARLTDAGLDGLTARTWARWHKEIWADLCGLLLGGPPVVASLIDVVAGTPAATLAYQPAGVHPTSYLRVLISVELLRRMGFSGHAQTFAGLWANLYPRPEASRIPPPMLESFEQANRLVVDTICFQPYPQLGGRSLAQVVRFKPAHEPMVKEAAGRLAEGVDPGILPARYLVGAVRCAIDRRLAPPARLARNFYQALADR